MSQGGHRRRRWTRRADGERTVNTPAFPKRPKASFQRPVNPDSTLPVEVVPRLGKYQGRLPANQRAVAQKPRYGENRISFFALRSRRGRPPFHDLWPANRFAGG